MADIAVSIPHGGGTIRTENNLRNDNIDHAFAHSWLGGTATTGPDNNLFISVRLQQDPDFAVIDLFTQNLRNTSQGKSLKRSRIYSLGGNAFNTNTNNFSERMINITRVNSTTALLKIPHSTSKSTYYVLEVNESTYDISVYTFEESNGGLYDYSNTSAYYPYSACHLFMKNVEDNVIVTGDQDGNSNYFLHQRVWDSTAKTLTSKRVASADGSGLDISNFSGQKRFPRYGSSNTGNSSDDFRNDYCRVGNTNGSQPVYINCVEGRDGKIHFRSTENGTSNYNVYYPENFALTYIPTSMGGDLATSGYSQSWGITGGFLDYNSYQYGSLTSNQGRYGIFLPIEVVESGDTSKDTNFPCFYMKSFVEIGGYNFKVHVDGTAGTEMNYTTSQVGNSSWAAKQATWLDSNHFFVHSNTSFSSYWAGRGSSYQRWYVNQYIDESYSENQGYGQFSGNDYNNMASNAGNQWTKVDDYTLTCQGFNHLLNIWAPE
tara:strand:- start:3195 stop:4661 length:1467 start_codon:yes stop_codon:yes gene_type:complete